MTRTVRTIVAAALATLAAAAIAPHAHSADPPMNAWRFNLTGAVGFNNIDADVQSVKYNGSYAYVSCTSIPSYSIGPWVGSPNTATNQNFTFRITRAPVVKSGTKTATGLGNIGVWANGVGMFNYADGRSYNNKNIWHNDAIKVEGPSFDSCGGHPSPGSEYHNHQNASCMYNEAPTVHSPIMGFAFDGYPVYGPYGYANADGTGGVRRIRSGYSLRSITTRTTLPNGTVLTATNYGPAVSATYPLGYFAEDYQYIAANGDLDANNVRFCVTPEYPEGTYAYFVTLSAAGAPAYPYMIGPSYHGVVDTANSSGHVTIPADAVAFNPLDLDESGDIDSGDIGLLLLNYGGYGPGDFDGSGEVDGGDLGLMLLSM